MKIQALKNYIIYKKIFIAMIFILMCQNILPAQENQYCADEKGDAVQTLELKDFINSQTSAYISSEIKHLHIIFENITTSTIDIHIPESVEDISLSSSSFLTDSTVHLYYSHSPNICKAHLQLCDSKIKPMHPIRQYTYHGLAIFGALTVTGLLMVAFDNI